MTTTWCERHGQVEVGVIEHDGIEYRAGGASVVGPHVTGYTNRGKRGDLSLTTWCGKTMLDCRVDVVDTYRNEYGEVSMALAFRLTKGRWIVGYSLGDGMLFRGELYCGLDEAEAFTQARMEAEYFSELDADDAANFDDED